MYIIHTSILEYSINNKQIILARRFMYYHDYNVYSKLPDIGALAMQVIVHNSMT